MFARAKGEQLRDLCSRRTWSLFLSGLSTHEGQVGLSILDGEGDTASESTVPLLFVERDRGNLRLQ